MNENTNPLSPRETFKAEAPCCWQSEAVLDKICSLSRNSSGAIAVYVGLTRLCNQKRSSCFTASQAEIAAVSGAAVRTVRDWLPVLVELGVIQINPRYEGSQRLADSITLLSSTPPAELASPPAELAEGEAEPSGSPGNFGALRSTILPGYICEESKNEQEDKNYHSPPAREASVVDEAPVSLENAVSRGEEMKIGRVVVEQWWHSRDAVGWTRRGQPIARWQSDLAAFNGSYKENEHGNNKHGNSLTFEGWLETGEWKSPPYWQFLDPPGNWEELSKMKQAVIRQRWEGHNTRAI